jgi:hypothetical protein
LVSNSWLVMSGNTAAVDAVPTVICLVSVYATDIGVIPIIALAPVVVLSVLRQVGLQD